MRHKIVITGGPASGKTESLALLKLEPELTEFIFFEELARKLLDQNPEYRSNWPELHTQIYHQTIKRESAAADRHFISDRGTIDAFAFHPDTMNNVKTTIAKEYKRYSAVIQLGSTASLKNGEYETDDIRKETPEEAILIELELRAAWSHHPNYSFLPAQHEFATKYDILCKKILNLIF